MNKNPVSIEYFSGFDSNRVKFSFVEDNFILAFLLIVEPTANENSNVIIIL